MIPHTEDTIVALATPPGKGAIGMVRVSGANALTIVQKLIKKDILHAPSHTLHYGMIKSPEGEAVDEVVIGIFRAPNSYTKEDVAEITAHGSPFILNKIIELIIGQGARLAEPGEFTLRAFLNGGLDLSQAEAVADLIASQSEQSRKLALHQLRGGFSKRLKTLRQELLDLASLLELELDFSEEDVEFADRCRIVSTVNAIAKEVRLLLESFRTGNAYKNGIPTVIIGKPNAGKSTLLNALLNENKAIVSDIPGTTRDVIEDRLFIGGYEFLIMDTAGLRASENVIEEEGIRRTHEKIKSASLVLWLYDVKEGLPNNNIDMIDLPADASILKIANKCDQSPETSLPAGVIGISALEKKNLAEVERAMVRVAESFTPYDTIVSNQRHAEALKACLISLESVAEGAGRNLSSELLAIDLRQALYDLGIITGEITNDEILGNIFSKFCIGK